MTIPDENSTRGVPDASVSYGPLLFALPISDTVDANTPDPSARWKFALDVQNRNLTVEREAMPVTWDWPLAAPLKVQVNAVQAAWNPDPKAPQLPLLPTARRKPAERLTLVPYGCTKFRISMFPITAEPAVEHAANRRNSFREDSITVHDEQDTRSVRGQGPSCRAASQASFLWVSCLPVAGVASAEDLGGSGVASGRNGLQADVLRLCRTYVEEFGSTDTDLVYHCRLNGPKGVNALTSPEEIARGMVGGRPMPYGYGSGIQDVALENGQLLVALCEAYEAIGDAELAELARRVFRGFRRVATVSPEPGFVPRGPHPDGKGYYRNSSRDQHAAFVEALYRYHHSPLATADDRRFIAEKLNAMARRMERNQWKILVEDNSEVAHVGFSWLGLRSVPAISLMSVLAQVADVTGDEHWVTLYHRYGEENEAERWRLISPERIDAWPPLTLYANQFAQALALWERCEHDEARKRQLREFQRRLAMRMLESNVFDPAMWRRLDWAGDNSPEAIEADLAPFGLSLERKATVFDVFAAFRGEFWKTGGADTRRINGKLLFGLPTVACHTVLLSGDAKLGRRVAPMVSGMVHAMLTHGKYYQSGEDFNRAVTLGLLLLAL